MIATSLATIGGSPLFEWCIALMAIATLAFAGVRNQKAGYKRERTNNALDVLVAWATANAELRGRHQHATTDIWNLAVAVGQQTPVVRPEQTYNGKATQNSITAAVLADGSST